jgi:predicted aspartyl protease
MTVDTNGHVIFTIALDGKAINAALDTGSVTSIMTAQAASKILGIDETSQGARQIIRNINRAPHNALVYPFQSLTIGDATIADPAILILDDADMNHVSSTDLVLGMNVLRQFHIYIAYAEGKLYLTPAQAH